VMSPAIDDGLTMARDEYVAGICVDCGVSVMWDGQLPAVSLMMRHDDAWLGFLV